MSAENLRHLINGSDIRGIAMDTEEHEANLTATEVKKIATGFVNYLREEKKISSEPLKIALGYDSRLSGPALKETLEEIFVEAGGIVLDAGLATTPAMFMATQFPETDADAGIMITASHLPYFYNGLKFFTKDGGANHEDIEKIIELADTLFEKKTGGCVESIPLITYYAADLVEKIEKGAGLEKPLKDFKIVLDAGNGAGGFFAEKVLQQLGADTTGSQFLDPDGNFPNHIPNPDNKEAMESIHDAVLENKADLGIIFDTDVDRAAVVDKKGEVINRNNLIALLAHILLNEKTGATIVTNSPTTTHLQKFIEDLGGKQYRYISGYRNVINKAIELNEEGIYTPLAIETSGHAAFQENYFLDDGAYIVAKILMILPQLRKQNQTIVSLIEDLKQPAEADEIRFEILADDFQAYGQDVIADLSEFVAETKGFEVEPENVEGIRVNLSNPFGKGWFLMRMSLHEPLLVLQVENDISDCNRSVFLKLESFLKTYEELDLVNLKKYLAE